MQLASGEAHNCFLIQDVESGPESLRCWGRNDYGQASPPRDLAPVMQLALGEDHSCALQSDGMVRCWGRSDLGQLAVPVFPAGQVTAIMSAPHSHSSCAQLADGSLRCWGGDELADSVPAQLRFSGVVMSVRQPPPGERAVIRFVDYRDRATTATFRVRVEVFGDVEVAAGIDYRLLDPTGKVLVAEPDGSYLLGGEPLPMALVEALDATVERPLLLYIRPVELLSAAPPRVPMRDQAQRVELTTGLARLRVSVPEGNIVLAAAQGTDTVHIGVRVEALDAMDRPVDSTGLLLVAEPIAGSLADWSPTADQPQALNETDQRGVFTGRLSARLGADDAAVRLRIGVVGFEMGLGIVVESTVVEVLRIPALAFTAGAARLTEGGDDVELRIALPLSHIGSRVEMVLTGSGTARLGSDYSLVVADSSQNIVIGDGIGMALTLEVQSAPAELMLLLRPRSDNHTRQRDRSLELRLSDYRADAEDDRAVILPPALRFEVVDDELPVVTFVATTDTVVEGEDDVSLRIGFPYELMGQRVVLRITAGGTAVRGTDYRLIAAAPEQNIVISYGTTATLTLEVPAASAEKLRLLLRPRSDDRISQGDRNLSLVITGVTAAAGVDELLALPAALRFSIRDDESAPAAAVRIVEIIWDGAIGCVERSDASIRCWDRRSQYFDSSQGEPFSASDFATVRSARDVAFSPELGSCWLLANGEVRCDGSSLLASYNLYGVVHVESSLSNSCAAYTAGQVFCRGLGYATNGLDTVVLSGQEGPVAQLALADSHGCALLSNGRVRCWEFSRCDLSSRTVKGCPQASPPNDLRSVTQLAVGVDHDCALTAAGGVRCWGDDEYGQSSPPDDLGPGSTNQCGLCTQLCADGFGRGALLGPEFPWCNHAAGGSGSGCTVGQRRNW